MQSGKNKSHEENHAAAQKNTVKRHMRKQDAGRPQPQEQPRERQRAGHAERMELNS